MQQSYKSITGTASALQSKGLTINGQPVDPVGFCILARYGAIKIIGKETKPEGRRGKPGTIFKVTGKPGFVVDFQEQTNNPTF